MDINFNNTNFIIHSDKKSELKQTDSKLSSPFARNDNGTVTKKRHNNRSFLQVTNQAKKVKLQTIFIFARQLSILLESGVPLLSSLVILSQQTEIQYFRTVIEKMKRDVNSGSTLTEAISKYPDVFPDLFISMVKAAEIGGNMAKVLYQLSYYLEKQNKLSKELNAAMVYPKFVSFFFLTVVLAIIFGLVPKFQEIFVSFNAQLPAPTLILIAISEFAQNNLIFEVIGIITLIIIYKKFKKTKNGRYIFDKLKLNLPTIGDVILKSALSKFCRTFSILINSGVTIVESIEIAGRTAQNILLIDAFREVKIGVTEGESLKNKLRGNPIFPPLLVSMIATGEESGSLEIMLNSISELYDAHVESKLTGLTSIIEPALMIALGIVVLIVIITLYLPIFQMSNIMQ